MDQAGGEAVPRRRTSRTAMGAVGLSLVMLGAGIGIGAGIWAGGSPVAAPASAPPAASNSVGSATGRPAAKVGTTGDYGVEGTLVFAIPPGQRVEVIPGSQPPYSNCTRDEQRLSFTSGPAPDSRKISMTAKATGGCWFEYSYNGWRVTVNGTFIGNFYLQQRPVSGRSYNAGCSASGDYRCTPNGLTATYIGGSGQN